MTSPFDRAQVATMNNTNNDRGLSGIAPVVDENDTSSAGEIGSNWATAYTFENPPPIIREALLITAIIQPANLANIDVQPAGSHVTGVPGEIMNKIFGYLMEKDSIIFGLGCYKLSLIHCSFYPHSTTLSWARRESLCRRMWDFMEPTKLNALAQALMTLCPTRSTEQPGHLVHVILPFHFLTSHGWSNPGTLPY